VAESPQDGARNVEVVRRYLALLQPGKLDALDDVVAEDLVVLAPDGSTTFSDRATWKQAMADEPFTDERIAVDELVADQHRVAVRYTVTAVHSKTVFGAEPTGRTVTAHGTKIYMVRDGKIVRIAGHDNVLGLLRQLGVTEIPT
jgi:steroid delta-isomerase-like uncharacterized protein